MSNKKIKKSFVFSACFASFCAFRTTKTLKSRLKTIEKTAEMRLFHRYSTRKHSTNDQPQNELKAANGLPWTKERPETVFSLNRSGQVLHRFRSLAERLDHVEHDIDGFVEVGIRFVVVLVLFGRR